MAAGPSIGAAVDFSLAVAQPWSDNGAASTPPPTSLEAHGQGLVVDLERRRDQLVAKVAELQWDLGGLVYEMAIRDRVKVDVIVRRAAALQEVDAELAEVERILRTEQTGTAGTCPNCSAPHSTGAVYCWQCGRPLMQHLAVPPAA